MNICLGTISWLPDDDRRAERETRLINFFNTVSKLWPEMDIVVITQNWKDFSIDVPNKIIRYDYKNGLGIIKARQVLRREFLKLKYDYILMFDDDAIIEETVENGAIKFLELIKEHPKGYCSYDKLNGTAVSTDIFKEVPFPPVDPSKDEAYEDWLFVELLNAQYGEYRFKVQGIKCLNGDRSLNAVSTWFDGDKDARRKILSAHSHKIVDYIKKYKKFPENWREMINQCPTQEIKKPDCKKPVKKEKTQAYSHDNTFLYF